MLPGVFQRTVVDVAFNVEKEDYGTDGTHVRIGRLYDGDNIRSHGIWPVL